MSIFKSIENKLEGLVEGGFGRAFKSSVQPVELAHKLAKEMGDHKTVGVSNVYVPNEFEVYLGEDDYEHLTSFADSLKAELSNYVTAFARREGWTLVAAAAHRALPRRRPARRRVRHRDAHRQRARREAPARRRAAAAADCRRRPRRAVPGPLLDQTVLYDQPPARPRAAGPSGGARAPCCAAPGANGSCATPSPCIGRSRRCDIVLTDPNVSRQHAEVRRQGDGSSVRDLGSHQRHPRQPARRQAGGAAARRPHRARHHRAALREARVTHAAAGAGASAGRRERRNDRHRPARPQDRHPGPALPVHLAGREDGRAQRDERRPRRRPTWRCPTARDEPVVGARPRSAHLRREERASERTIAGEKLDFTPHINPRLVVEESPIVPPGVIFPLEGWITVGRAPTSDIVLDEQFVSSTHARLVPRGQFYYVEDLGSTNGTFVNEKASDGGAAQARQPGCASARPSSATRSERPVTLVARHAALTDIGLHRKTNEDAFVVAPPLFAVCDGMGGAQAGEVASGLAAETLAARGRRRRARCCEAAARGQRRRVRARQRPHRADGHGHDAHGRASSTATQGRFAHVGDSRAYLLRDGELRAAHRRPLAGRRDGPRGPPHARRRPRSIRIAASSAGRSAPSPRSRSTSSRSTCAPGDVLLLCSDGLSGVVGGRRHPRARSGAPDPTRPPAGSSPRPQAPAAATTTSPPSWCASTTRTTPSRRRRAGAATPPRRLPMRSSPRPTLERRPRPSSTDARGAAAAAAARRRADARRGHGAEPARPAASRAAGSACVADRPRRAGARRPGRRVVLSTCYFVGVDDGGLAVYSGLPVSVGPLDLHAVYRRSALPYGSARRHAAQAGRRAGGAQRGRRHGARRRSWGCGREPAHHRAALPACWPARSAPWPTCRCTPGASARSTACRSSTASSSWPSSCACTSWCASCCRRPTRTCCPSRRCSPPSASPRSSASGPRWRSRRGSGCWSAPCSSSLTVVVVRDHMRLDRYRYLIGAIGLALLVVTIVLGTEVNGARLWIHAFGFSIQPSEFAKLAIVIFLAGYLNDKKVLLSVPTHHVLGVPRAGRQVLRPVARHVGAVAGHAGLHEGLRHGAAVHVHLRRPHVHGDHAHRLRGARRRPVRRRRRPRRGGRPPRAGPLHASGSTPGRTPQTTGYQLLQSLFTIADGGVLGAGFGRGFLLYADRQPVVPDLQTDFIFTAIANEMGLLGAVAVVLCYLLFVWRGFRIAVWAPDGFSQAARRRAGHRLRAADVHHHRRRHAPDPAHRHHAAVRELRRQLHHRQPHARGAAAHGLAPHQRAARGQRPRAPAPGGDGGRRRR